MPEQKEVYKYPLEDDGKYKAKVIFSLVQDRKVGDASAQFLQSELANKENSKKKLDEQAVDNGISDAEQTEAKKSLLSFLGSDKGSSKGAVIQVPGTKVELYLPMGLIFNDGVQYSNFELGGAGASMEAGLGFAESMLKGVGSFVTNISGGGGADLARLAGIQLSSQAGTFGDEVRAVQKLSGGLTLNPNERVLFDKPNIREFAFSFKFIAKSEKEAQQVEDIIKFFRTELYPDEITTSVGESSISLGYRFPNKFNIGFQYDGDEIPGLAKIKPCYLLGVDTTYNGSQMAMHKDGRFMEIDMTIRFRETKALTRKDVSKGGF
jgi:hypothetical protein